MPFKVMLSAKFEKDPKLMQAQLEALNEYPYLASPKYDGIRAYLANGKVLSRNNELIPNRYVQSLLGESGITGVDGELIVGKPNVEGVFQTTTSGVMSINGEPNFKLYVFDAIPGLFPFRHKTYPITGTTGLLEFEHRQTELHEAGEVHQPDKVVLVEQVLVRNLKQLLAYEAQRLKAGYEGIMLRKPTGPYKQGRSTLREGWLMAVKRFVDSEAEVLGCYEQEANTNTLTTSKTGHAKRSSAKAGKVGKGILGGFNVRDIHTGVEFKIGVLQGVSNEQRRIMWVAGGKGLVGKLVKYRYQPVGVKNKPRLPTFIGFRDRRDM